MGRIIGLILAGQKAGKPAKPPKASGAAGPK